MNTSTRAILAAAALLSLTTLTTGCPKKDAGGGDGAAADDKKKSGLDAPGNDPAFVAATKSAIQACASKWDPKTGFDDCSDPLKAWRDKKFEGIDATLLSTLEDEDIKVRWFGSYAIGSWGSSYKSDKALASRLFGILENEKAGSMIDAHLAYAAASAYESAGLADRLKAHGLKATTALDVKEVLAAWWSNEAGGYEITKSLAASADKKSVKAAAAGYASHFSKHEDEACKHWAAHFEDDDKDVRTSAVGHLTGGWSGNTTHDAEGDWYISGGGGGPSGSGDAWCPAQIDDALAKIAKRAAANTIDDSNYVYGLANLVKHKKTSDAQRKLAVATLKKIIETKGARQRSFALRRLVDAKPDEKAYAARFVKDDDLKTTALDVTKVTARK